MTTVAPFSGSRLKKIADSNRNVARRKRSGRVEPIRGMKLLHVLLATCLLVTEIVQLTEACHSSGVPNTRYIDRDHICRIEHCELNYKCTGSGNACVEETCRCKFGKRILI
ncbi:hypothetical protein LSAT2_001308 [Lamellibrachia satsuma]|nr:hypothetical protein LSAT2_001308 [Lamellibrachia satsuma]